MNLSWVMDCSVGFSWVHPAQASPDTERLLEEVENGAAPVVPILWFAEIANTLLVLQRRGKMAAMDRKKAMETLSRFTLIVDEEAGKAAFGSTSDLAENFDLTIYDATYLEIALRRKLPLATRDGALQAAARKAGVKVL